MAVPGVRSGRGGAQPNSSNDCAGSDPGQQIVLHASFAAKVLGGQSNYRAMIVYHSLTTN